MEKEASDRFQKKDHFGHSHWLDREGRKRGLEEKCSRGGVLTRPTTSTDRRTADFVTARRHSRSSTVLRKRSMTYISVGIRGTTRNRTGLPQTF
ncbi:hypothetical protein ANTRET_LOCUS2544 [Anthophora retusa]